MSSDVSSPSVPTVQGHIDSLSEPARTIFLDLRAFVLSLGANVIEQPRPHRIAYSKTLNLRIFLELIPSGDRLLLTTRRGRSGGSPESLELASQDKLEFAKKMIAEAYKNIQ
jgi:hypothetical protein